MLPFSEIASEEIKMPGLAFIDATSGESPRGEGRSPDERQIQNKEEKTISRCLGR